MALTPRNRTHPRLRQLAAICWNLLLMVLLMVLLVGCRPLVGTVGSRCNATGSDSVVAPSNRRRFSGLGLQGPSAGICAGAGRWGRRAGCDERALAVCLAGQHEGVVGGTGWVAFSHLIGQVQPVAAAMPGQSRAASRVRRCMVEPRWEVSPILRNAATLSVGTCANARRCQRAATVSIHTWRGSTDVVQRRQHNAWASPGVRAPFMLTARFSRPVRPARVRYHTCAAFPPGWCGAGRAAGRRGRPRPGCVPVLR